jgi:hypothetical protein
VETPARGEVLHQPAPSKGKAQAPTPVHAPRETTPDDHGTVPLPRNDAPAAQSRDAGQLQSDVRSDRRDIERIEDGPLSGFSIDEYVSGVVNGIHDAMGEVDLLTAGCALDQALGEFLNVAYHAEGAKAAQAMGVKFCETALPFAQLQPEPAVTYGEIKKLVKRNT